jgi:putative photosynthetic complex assembly protein
MTNRLKHHPGKLSAAQQSDGSLLSRLNKIAPFLIITFVVGLAAAITIDEWRSGTMGISRVTESRDLLFARQSDGTMKVSQVADGGVVAVLPSAEEGFVAMTIKSMTRERRKFNVAETEPYRLARTQNGRLSLTDPVTGIRIELIAFGSTNIASFAQLLAAKPRLPELTKS